MPEENLGPGGLAAGLGCTLGLAAGLVVARRRGEKCASKKSLQAGVLGALLGAGGGFLTAALVNSAFDTSPPEYREVQVLEFWQTTHSFLFRDYSIEYREFPDGKREKVAARVEKMQAFGVRLGALEIGRGALGMTWIRDIHPLQLALLPGGDADGDDTITVEVEGEDGAKKKVSFRAHFPSISAAAPKPSPQLLAEAGRQL